MLMLMRKRETVEQQRLGARKSRERGTGRVLDYALCIMHYDMITVNQMPLS